jgi:hypothetical protein
VIKTDLPLALFPVRLETHFVTPDAGSTQLLVRVYPDDVHVDSHEPELTEAEETWGKHYWEQTWRAGGDAARERSAWAQLAELFGPARAAHIADAVTPLDPADKPRAPVRPEQRLSPPPRFPEVPRRAGTWTRAPSSYVLPGRWVALGYAAGQRVFTHWGDPIPEGPLAVGPSPETGFDADGIAADPSVGWLVDFQAAERVGMGLRIFYTLPAGGRLDRLLVLGVNPALSGAEGAARLESLLRAHRYTQGLGFVPQGTPTNNTPDAPSGLTSLDPGYEISYRLRTPIPLRAGDGSNGDVTARALGIDPGAFTKVRGADELEQRDAYHMNTALWRATWGYFLEQLMAGAGSPSDADIRRGREHFASYVRARGPLPALRIGAQPYGVLPVVSLDRWRPLEGGPIDAPLVRFLRSLREVWRRSLPNVPRVSGRLSDAGGVEAILRVLAMEPASTQYVARRAQAIALLPTTPGPNAASAGAGGAKRLARALGIPWTSRHVRTVFAPYTRATRFAGSVVQPGQSSAAPSETAAVEPNYLRWLAGAPYGEIRQEQPGQRAETLLYLLLRHAALLEYAAAAFRILLGRGLAVPDDRRERDMVLPGAPTPWRLLDRAIPGLAPAVGTYLDLLKPRLYAGTTWDAAVEGAIWRRDVYRVEPAADVPADVTAELDEFAAFARSLRHLADRPAAALGRLLAETLDLCSHRFDAWATSFATRRLEWLRGRAPRGVYLGGYGWVEDLGPGATRQQVEPPSGVDAPLYASSGNYGYVHAPSLAHATTAAVLRSGYLSRRAMGDGDALAVNLSSDRVRLALWLLDGVRQGQSLGALLGYRFERSLHEDDPRLLLDRYIPAFRRIAPLDVGAPTPGAEERWRQTVEALPATGVVDGLALLKRWKAPAGDPLAIPWGVGGLLPDQRADREAYDACVDALRRLEDAVDAVGDLALAEAVHQVAQGNPVRAGATLDAIARGEAPPPDPEVVRTPRTGVGLAHRLVVAFRALPPSVPGWGPAGARAMAEPFLNAWASQLFGPAAPAARCRVTYLDPAMDDKPLVDDSGRERSREVTLADLGLSPIDLLYLPESQGEARRSELEQRVIYHVLRSRPADVPAGAGVRLAFGRDPGWPAETLSFAELLEAARPARRLITSSRALAAADLALPDAAIPPEAEADLPPAGEPADAPARALRLGDRADAAVLAFRRAAADLRAVLPVPPPPVPGRPLQPAPTIGPELVETVRERMMRLAAFGIPGAVPLEPVGDAPATREALQDQAISVEREATKRVQHIDEMETGYRREVAASPPSPAATRDYHLARLRGAFGPEFRVLPRFTPPNAADLGEAFAASDALQGGSSLEAITWLRRTARVRDGAARLDDAMLYAEALGGDPLDLSVGQLPFEPGDRWVGLSLTAPQLPGGRLSLMALSPAGTVAGLPAGTPLAGLLVDEWAEVVPGREETTGLAFHFDGPGARAPHAILLAVSPDDRPEWDLETLEATVLEALELAKLRAVDLAALAEIGHYLPALYFGHNPSGETVSTDFGRVAESAVGR